MTRQICVHSKDKKYVNHDVRESQFSSQSFNGTLTHGTIPNDNALNKQVWDNSEIIYWTNDSDYEHISLKDQEKIIKLALLESSLETPLVIRQRKRKSADAQIKINWLKKKDEKYFKSDSTLAFGYGPGWGLGGNTTMNADVLWIPRRIDAGPMTVKEAYDLGYIENYNREFPNSSVKTYDPLHTLKHECGGHNLGCNHLTDVNLRYSAVMFPYYNGLRRFGTADKKYLHSLYGKASVNHKIKENLLARIFNGISV